MSKFEDLNMHFESLGTHMILRAKFENWWCILLNKICITLNLVGIKNI